MPCTNIAVRSLTCHTATGIHMPYRIAQCYLPPDRGDISAFTPAEIFTNTIYDFREIRRRKLEVTRSRVCCAIFAVVNFRDLDTGIAESKLDRETERVV